MVTHDDFDAVEYEFYIPAAVFDHSATKDFIARLKTIQPSATISKGLQGVWQGSTEDTNIFKMVLRKGQFDAAQLRSVLRSEIGRLVASLSAWTESKQGSVLFTEREIHVCLSSL